MRYTSELRKTHLPGSSGGGVLSLGSKAVASIPRRVVSFVVGLVCAGDEFGGVGDHEAFRVGACTARSLRRRVVDV